jgi:hypothetical protein
VCVSQGGIDIIRPVNLRRKTLLQAVDDILWC